MLQLAALQYNTHYQQHHDIRELIDQLISCAPCDDMHLNQDIVIMNILPHLMRMTEQLDGAILCCKTWFKYFQQHHFVFICQSCLKADEQWSNDAIIECGKVINAICGDALTELQYMINTPFVEQCKQKCGHWDDQLEQDCRRIAERGYLGRMEWGGRDLVSVRRKGHEVIVQLEDIEWHDYAGIPEDDLETEPVKHFLHHDVTKAMTVLYLYLLKSVSCRQQSCIGISINHIELFTKLGASVLDTRELFTKLGESQLDIRGNCSTALAFFGEPYS